MSTPTPRPLPPAIKIAASALILFHLTALVALALTAPSGPWPTQFGASTALPPPFALAVNEFTFQHYLRHLNMTHNYHFQSNNPEAPAVEFEVKLKDKLGSVTTLKFPDPSASFWVRHRQQLLAQALADDTPVESRLGQIVLPKGKKAPTILAWKGVEGSSILRLEQISELELTGNNRQMMRPSEWSLILARAYVRHLCRQRGADSGELLRRHRNAIHPTVLFMEGPLPPETFEERVSNFGEVRP